MQTQVLIIGAGPTGLSLANQFVRYGIDFVIIDKKENVTELSKALVVHARSLEIYEQLGLSEKAVEIGQVMHKIRMLNNGKIRAEVPITDIGKGFSPFPFALILEQSKNEHLLSENLVKQGKSVLWQTELENLSQDLDCVKAILKKSDGQTFEVEAKYLVGCDGASSPTRHLLNLDFGGSTIPRLFYVADIEMKIELPHDILNVTLGDNAFVLLMPMKGENHWRLIGNLPDDTDGDGEVSQAEIVAKVKQLVKMPLDISTFHWLSNYKIHSRHVEKFSKKRCFLAGDSAHIHSPAGGQGMNTGIQDAYNLAWKIAFVLKGLAGEKLLDTYNEERLTNAIRLLKTTDQAFEIFTADKWYLRILREKILPTAARYALQLNVVKRFIFPTLSQIGISYDKNSLSKHGGDSSFKIKAGNRFPYFKIEGENFFNYLREPKFHFISFGNGSIADTEKTKYAEEIDFEILPLTVEIRRIFATDEPFSVLVRPDNYIAFLSKNNSAAEIEKYFASHIK
jgi:2-polyprenyl-6-methoxyphenol hydroxylase-like FAD-dependent oxidoreductase